MGEASHHTHLDQRAVLHAELESLAKPVRSESHLGVGAGDVLLQRGETRTSPFFQDKETFHDHLQREHETTSGDTGAHVKV